MRLVCTDPFTGAFSVVDDLVRILGWHALVADPLVGVDGGTWGDVLATLTLQGVALGVRNMLHAHLSSVAVQQSHDDGLSGAAGALHLGGFGALPLVHEAGESANETLVGLDLAAVLSHRLIKGALGHRFADAVEHEPRRLLFHADGLPKLVRADAVLAVDDKPHGDKPLVEADRAVLEDGPLLDREHLLCVFVLALPESARGQVAVFLAAAGWAGDAVRPAECNEEVLAAVQIGKVTHRRYQGFRPFVLVHVCNLTQGLGESSGLSP